MAKNILIIIFLYSTILWAQKNNDPFEQLYMKTMRDVAGKDINRALKIADSMTAAATTPQHRGRGLMLTASLYLQQNKNEESIKFAEKAKTILDTSENIDLKAKIRGLLTSEYRIIGLNNKAKKYADEGLELADKITDEQKKAQVKSLFYQELGYYEMEEKNYRQAIQNLNQSLDYLSKIPDDKINLGKTYQLLGENYLELHDYKNSDIYHLKAIEILPEGYIGSALSFIGLGISKTNQKQYPDAEKYLLKGLQYAETSDHPAAKRTAYDGLAHYYDDIKDYEKANIYRKKYVEVFKKTETKYNKTVDKDYNKIEIEKDHYANWNSKKNIVLGIATLSILSLMIIFIMNRKRQKEEYQKFKSIINHYKEKEEYVLESRIITSEMEETENVEQETVTEEANTESKQMDIAISKETEAKILEQLNHFEKDEMFNNPSISLSFLAAEFNTNIRYISYVVKKHKGADFKSYINKLRINYIIHKLNTSSKYRKYKVKALAEECGFAYHSKFATVFKSLTGISPSTFITFIEQEEAKNNKK
ncbi:helix-turn-helix domain-containing protein [Chryseobacterium sp. JUb7]|uniref:helix-turn-helix domain-containing protein n=1 Tax=Chryseobacterium sp. JUb7 TaxID=2940599 RepID=UPI0021695626|nr:helix-turn-helix domain-containing protein [Chryseobacterium sp. JUb7]MCS3532980.1 AraC-like DNA-binding protein [Chryseobacterium sp. JUb7]